jgi:hypothetical protein
MQVSPCKIKKIKNLLSSEQRGVLIFLIEEYFKTTHNFRGVEDVNVLNNKNINITPSSYVDFINNFDLSNLTNAKTIFHKKNKHSTDSFGKSFTRIPNIGFPELDGYKISNLSIKDYINSDEIDQLMNISNNGQETESKINNIPIIIMLSINKINVGDNISDLKRHGIDMSIPETFLSLSRNTWESG